jgi:hypothetical protein
MSCTSSADRLHERHDCRPQGSSFREVLIGVRPGSGRGGSELTRPRSGNNSTARTSFRWTIRVKIFSLSPSHQSLDLCIK